MVDWLDSRHSTQIYIYKPFLAPNSDRPSPLLRSSPQTSLEKLRKRHESNPRAIKSFEVPRPYAYITIPGYLAARNTVTANGHRWLWDTCLRSLMDLPLKKPHSSVIVVYRQLQYNGYPPRVPLPEPLPPAFKALRTLLDDAPTESHGLFPEGKVANYTTVTYHCLEEEEEYFWARQYFRRVYKALIHIIEEHGVGDEGWGSARWMVYDQVCFSDACV